MTVAKDTDLEFCKTDYDLAGRSRIVEVFEDGHIYIECGYETDYLSTDITELEKLVSEARRFIAEREKRKKENGQ